MRNLLEFIYSELASGRPVVSAVIVTSSGSTPRSTGSRMAVSVDGRCQGSVGGGPGEAMAQRKAQTVHQTWHSTLLSLDLSGKEAADAGMICGGKQEILLEYIPADHKNAELFSRLLTAWDAGQASSLCTVFIQKSQETIILDRTLDSASLADSVPAPLREEARRSAHTSRLPTIAHQDACTLLVEPIRPPGTVFIAGAGHVGQTTADLAAYVGFRTIIIDDRADFLIPERFPRAGRLHHAPGFEACFQQLDMPADSFIVIVTRGHVHDKNVLTQALQTRAEYIGMIGSKKKRKAIYEALRQQGVAQSALDQVHCPIGLSIGADTPEEIAVSIVAELIQERVKVG
ncbi:MAG: XdhC family protein [Desulfovermiculus sp.]|nr:XdhC family protein [Desulfovermiculus sp.]